MKIREALLTMAPSLALQRAAADEIARLDARIKELESPGSIPMPKNEDQAAGMALVGESWLRANAPHRLKEKSE